MSLASPRYRLWPCPILPNHPVASKPTKAQGANTTRWRMASANSDCVLLGHVTRYLPPLCTEIEFSLRRASLGRSSVIVSGLPKLSRPYPLFSRLPFHSSRPEIPCCRQPRNSSIWADGRASFFANSLLFVRELRQIAHHALKTPFVHGPGLRGKPPRWRWTDGCASRPT
jgi:hypothetical protein